MCSSDLATRAYGRGNRHRHRRLPSPIPTRLRPEVMPQLAVNDPARPSPDAAAMLEDAQKPSPFQGRGGSSAAAEGEGDFGLHIFAPTDMAIHCATHLIADGDLSGGLRNLWDMHCLLTEFGGDAYWPALKSRAEHHQLWPAVHRAARQIGRAHV